MIWIVFGLTPAPVYSEPHSPATIVYTVRPELQNAAPDLHIEMRFHVPDGSDHIDLQMPVWSPGDYHIQNHARYVQQFRAKAEDLGSRRLNVTRPDPQTWRIDTEGGANIIVDYILPETDPGIFSENIHFQPHYTFVAGPAAYLYVVGCKQDPAQVTVYPPAGWQAEMPLPEVKLPDAEAARPDATQSAITYAASDYDTLADSPLVMGDAQGLTIRKFTVDNVVHKAVFFGQIDALKGIDDYTPVLQKIAQAENDIMGGPPYSRYDFLFAVGESATGLEHLNSARIGLWPNATPHEVGSLVAHEFFHLWNVKRIRPQVLGPFDYIDPPRTRNLWFAEGVTEYYANIALRRAGLSSKAEFLNHWRRAISTLQSNPARLRVTADQASQRVWEAGDSEGFGGLSYYVKGELIGLCLDLKIRKVTANRKSLDDVMRALLKKCNPPNPGYGEDELRATVNEAAGQDLTDFYNLLARSTEEMPFAECLGYAGLDAEAHPLPNATPEMLALRASWSAAK
jgi:predicted metalloprotease with PDZ domain